MNAIEQCFVVRAPGGGMWSTEPLLQTGALRVLCVSKAMFLFFASLSKQLIYISTSQFTLICLTVGGGRNNPLRGRALFLPHVLAMQTQTLILGSAWVNLNFVVI